MAYDSLREFVDRLDRAGELLRVSDPVRAELDITAIADRFIKAGGDRPALLFENVEGSDFPVLINAYASPRRMAWALGVEDVEEHAARIEEIIKIKPPSGWVDKLKMLPKLAELGSFAPKRVKSGPCQEVVEEAPSFASIPILRCWPNDAGRYITLPMVVSRDPKTGDRNVGMYRVQITDERTALMHWQIHKDGARHAQDARGKGRMPVAICLGGDPAAVYSGSAPLPPEIDEFLFTGFLRRKPLPLVPCRTIPLEVPADCDWVLEGEVDPDDLHPEGPFGDHTGFYTPVEPYPVFHLKAITRRKDPIYLTTVVGRPPMEDFWIGNATERIFMPLIRAMLPEIVDLHMPAEGIFNNLVVVAIRKRYPGHTRKVMHALWGLGQMAFTKWIVMVDADVDPRDSSKVAWLCGTNVDPRRDTVIVDGPVDTLNHASPRPNYGSKIGIDATSKGPDDGYDREWPEVVEMEPRPEITALIERLEANLR